MPQTSSSNTIHPSTRRQPQGLCLLFLLLVIGIKTSAQDCPPNIDFERGDFSNWTCYIGNTQAVGSTNVINLSPTGPTPDRHTMIPANSAENDFYGGFPVNCPNGSGYSIRLGNNAGGGEAEGISYQFTIPQGRNEYSLIYHYAVVFQDPVHQIYQQPRMEVEVRNLTDGTVISCSSFTFVPFGSILPGFFASAQTGSDGTAVWCKDWSAVSVNLENLAGKTIQLFFKTADCTFRRHFGYAYIDVNSECSSEFTGAAYCPDDTAVTVLAPYGYQGYRWFNQDFSQVIGTQQSIRFSPPPVSGTSVAVELTPYSGYGCTDTLYARLLDTLTLNAFAGPDALYCGTDPVPLGLIPKPGLVYSWSPGVGLTNPAISNPRARPDTTTLYTLSVRSLGGGCLNQDAVLVKASNIRATLELMGKDVFCLGNNDSAVLHTNAEQRIQWYRDGAAIQGATQTRYPVAQSGSYYARLINADGCATNSPLQTVFIDKPLAGIRYADEYAIHNLPYQLEARGFGTKYQWRPPSHLDNPSIAKPVFRWEGEQQYTVRIETTTGCITIDTVLVKTVPNVQIFVPTAFTPNKDGRNDILRPVLMGVRRLNYFKVFNRWGQVVFEGTRQTDGWDGTINGVQQPSGVVVWVAEGLGSDGRVHTRKGTAMLIR